MECFASKHNDPEGAVMDEAYATAVTRVCLSCGVAKPAQKFDRPDEKEKGHRRLTCTACRSRRARKRAKELGRPKRRYGDRKRGPLCAEQLHAAK